MGKHRRTALFLLPVLGVVLFAWAILAPSEKEPVYEGKPLRLWLTNYLYVQRHAGVLHGNMLSTSEKLKAQADNAVRAVGTNGIPFYLRLLQSRDQPWRTQLANHLPFLKTNQTSVRENWAMAQGAFDALGADGRAAIPRLLEICEHDRVEGGPWDPDPRCFAAGALGSMGSWSRPAIPVLVRGATNENFHLALSSISALGRIATEPDLPVVLPVLTQGLTNKNLSYRITAVESLNQLGSLAKPAVPALFDLLKNPDPAQKNVWNYRVIDVICHIDPETAGLRAAELDAAKYGGGQFQ